MVIQPLLHLFGKRAASDTASLDPSPAATAPLPRITIGGWTRSYPGEVLSGGEDPHLHLLVSLGNPGETPPPWLEGVSADQTLRLEFGDTTFGAGDPVAPPMTARQMTQLLRAAERINLNSLGPGEALRIHLHCTAGVSRSTACAAAIMGHLYPYMHDHRVLRHIQQARPSMSPNGHILNLADHALNRQLLSAWLHLCQEEGP